MKYALFLFTLVPALAQAGSFTVKDMNERFGAVQRAYEEAEAIKAQIKKLTDLQYSAENKARQLSQLSPEEIASLLQNSPNNLPDYCKVSAQVEGDKIATTVMSTKENKLITSRTDYVTRDGADDQRQTRTKLWSYNANLIMNFSNEGVLTKVSVSDRQTGAWVSCPYEAPFRCNGCE